MVDTLVLLTSLVIPFRNILGKSKSIKIVTGSFISARERQLIKSKDKITNTNDKISGEVKNEKCRKNYPEAIEE